MFLVTQQWSQNVEAGGPHHRPHQLMASSSFDCHRLVEWGRHNELEASMVGAANSHVLGSLWRSHIFLEEKGPFTSPYFSLLLPTSGSPLLIFSQIFTNPSLCILNTFGYVAGRDTSMHLS